MTEKLKDTLIQLSLLEHICRVIWRQIIFGLLSYLRMFRIKKDPTAIRGPDRFSQVRAYE